MCTFRNWVYHIYWIVSHGYNVFFIVLCGLESKATYVFYSLAYQKLTLSLAVFCQPNSSYALLFSITCMLCHKRIYDEQKAVVVV